MCSGFTKGLGQGWSHQRFSSSQHMPVHHPHEAPSVGQAPALSVGVADPEAWYSYLMIFCAFVFFSVFKKIFCQGELLEELGGWGGPGEQVSKETFVHRSPGDSPATVTHLSGRTAKPLFLYALPLHSPSH